MSRSINDDLTVWTIQWRWLEVAAGSFTIIGGLWLNKRCHGFYRAGLDAPAGGRWLWLAVGLVALGAAAQRSFPGRNHSPDSVVGG